jgi:Ca2+-binding RTX toxin-like protein
MATINGTSGDDTLNSSSNSFGGDVFTGGAGNDTINGGSGNDTVNQNVTTDGADRVNLDGGQDRVNITANLTTNVRLTFTSAEVGDGRANDAGTLANQDGGLAVRLQAEDASGALTGPISRYDDEGVGFFAGPNVTFDVRDLVTGAARGEQFSTVVLGSSFGDFAFSFSFGDNPFGGTAGADYINGGGGDDFLQGAGGNDFLVGGTGNDNLDANTGQDTVLGGSGNDFITSAETVNFGSPARAGTRRHRCGRGRRRSESWPTRRAEWRRRFRYPRSHIRPLIVHRLATSPAAG